MKLKPADIWFSKCIRERAEWTCERCGRVHARGSRALHCSHFFSRRHRATRWSPDNAAAHCYGCHVRLGGDPVLFTDWIRKYLGETRFDMLRDRHNQSVKISKVEEKEIARHYKAQYEFLLEKRSQGVTGYLDLVAW